MPRKRGQTESTLKYWSDFSRITDELISGGFAWERKRKPAPVTLCNPFRYDLLPPPRKQKREPGYHKRKSREYAQKKREKWLMLGIVKPTTDADRAFMAKLERAA